MARNSGGNRGDVRQSALWGSGNRGGELRSNALWGKGGRGVVVLMLLALSMPLAASAGDGKGVSVNMASATIAENVLEKARNAPNEKIRVIVRAKDGFAAAKNAAGGLGQIKNELGIIDAVAVELPAGRVAALAKNAGLTVTMDEPAKQLGDYTSNQLWTSEAGFNRLWTGPQAPTIAIIDSGIDAGRADFSGRVLTQVSFVTSGTNSAGDGRGHGTFVAGIAAGSAPGYAGGAPNANLVSVDVLNDAGSGYTSDVIKGAEWVLANKAKYGIRVANFSLHSGNVSRFYDDPLNLAVNKLWFNGIVVVAAAGNYGKADGPSHVPHSPGNNPFVITVGAADIGGSHKLGDDSSPSWSAYGRTPDGFWKPEICAAGRYMIGPVPASSTLAAARPEQLRDAGYIELSGTSFAAPVVSALAAQILARYPSYTPDQVKGLIMAGARPVPQAAPNSCGVGQVNSVKTATWTNVPPNPNLALNAFVSTNLLTGEKTFDAVSWSNVSWSNVSWSNVSWSNVSWSGVSWSNVSWSDVSWSNVSWSNVSWSNSAMEDAAGDASGTGEGYELTPEEEAAAAFDPDLLMPGETLPTVETATAETSTSTDATTESTSDATSDSSSTTDSTTSTLTSTLP